MTPASPRPLVAALALVATACASGRTARGPLHPVDPAQAVEGAPAEAHAELDRIGVRAAVGGWEGQPRDLELRLTPVDVTVANGAARPLRLGPEAFRLVTPNGASYRVLTREEVSAALAGLAGFRPRPAPSVGAVGGPTFPGYDSPYAGGAPHPVPPARQWYVSQLPSATLDPGRQTSILLFFDVPGRSLGAATLELELVDGSGARLGTLRIPFARG